jgi:hypothetical protein
MSWSASFKLKHDVVEDEVLSNVVGVDEHVEQYALALTAVRNIVDSLALGDSDDTYAVNMSGHGNPGHRPTKGWANDCLNISITQLGEAE